MKDASFYWGNNYIMVVETTTVNDFIVPVKKHIEAYWYPVSEEKLTEIWKELTTTGRATFNCFEFYGEIHGTSH